MRSVDKGEECFTGEGEAGGGSSSIAPAGHHVPPHYTSVAPSLLTQGYVNEHTGLFTLLSQSFFVPHERLSVYGTVMFLR